jgi:hypothetical protein
MKRDIVAKRVIQAVACGFGLLGLFCVYDAVYFAVIGIPEPAWHETLIASLLSLIPGGIMLVIAWRALRHFGPNVIRIVVGLVMFLAWFLLARLPLVPRDGGPRWRSNLLNTAIVLGPPCLAFLLYRIISRKLIQMTGTGASDNGPDPNMNPNEHESTG